MKREIQDVSIFHMCVLAICNAREHLSMHSRDVMVFRGECVKILRAENTMRAVRAVRKVMQSGYKRIGAVCGCWSMHRRRSKYWYYTRVARAMKKSESEIAFAPPRDAAQRVDQQ